MKCINNQATPRGRKRFAATLLAAGFLMVPSFVMAQSAVVGGLGNFDAANFEGKDAHGLEIQIEGIQPGDLTPSWCGNKYNCPVVTSYGTGVYIRYVSPYDAATGRFTATTVPHAPNTAFAGTCYQWSPTYNASGCDHFGIHLGFTAAAQRATTTSYRWMFEDPSNPGQLIASTNNLFVPTPVYSWIPPAVPAAPPVLVVEIQLPDPPPPPPAAPPQYGDAVWMKVYKTEMNREVFLDELTSDNPIVPQTLAQLETEWSLLQPEPPNLPADGRRRRNRQTNQGGVSTGTRAVLRRYETYAYTGAYDPTTHQVACGGDATCTSPQPGELGDMLVAQMAAANVAVPGITVVLNGNGTVSSSDKVISCGSKCVATYALGTAVTLTAKAGSNSTFTGWTGACSGTSLTCSVSISDALTTTATCTVEASGGGGVGGGGTAATFKLTVSRAGKGVVSSNPAGIACGSGGGCSLAFAAGTSVTLTATPDATSTWTGWSGACTGTATTCTVVLSADKSVTATFR